MAATRKQLTSIGTTEFIDFPDDGILNVPAKIDTGADSSAVWASNITVEDGMLTFNFFAPGSTFYKPEPTRTTAYKSTVVKNSFGQSEVRYKVRVKVRIGGRKLTTWFSLADRSRNNYPVLLGKTFLKNRFVVDVSQNLLMSSDENGRDVLVLSGNRAATADFFKEVAARSNPTVDYTCTSYGSLLFEIDGLETRVLNTAAENRDLGQYALTYFKSHNSNAELAAATAEYLKYKSRRFVDCEVGCYTSASKLSEAMRLAMYGIRLPKTIVAKTRLLKTMYDQISQTFGVPFVLKEIGSDRGNNNYLVSQESEFRDILAGADATQIYMAQQYIENQGFLRLYVLGNEVALAVWRTPHPHDDPLKQHLNKPHGSVNAAQVDVSEVAPEAVHAAVMAASCMQRQIAGVDLVQDVHTKEWYVLEVNNAPQLRTGSFVSEKAEAVAQFIDKELNR